MQVITISGVDGSGKSTQAAAIVSALEARGEKVYTLHAVQFGLANIIAAKLGKGAEAATAQTDSGASKTSASGVSIFLRMCFLIVDSVRFWLLKNSLARRGYTAIVSDRSFFDIVVNIRFLQGRTQIGLLERIVPRADTAFLLSVEPARIMARDRAPEQGQAYLEKKNTLLHGRAALWHMTIVDADQPINDVTHTILALL